MSSGTVGKQIAGERGELYVFGELLKRGAISYVPLVDDGVDALVRTSEGTVIEIQVKAAGRAHSTGYQFLFGGCQFSKPPARLLNVAVRFKLSTL